MWYLLWCDHDNSYSMIHEQQVLAVGDIEIGDNVQFFYGNKPYVGKVAEMNEDREVIDQKLKSLGTTAKRSTRKTPSAPIADTLLSKRRRSTNPPTGTDVSGKRKDEAAAEQKDDGKKLQRFKNKRLLEMNRKISSMKENKRMLGETGKSAKDSDDEWLPSFCKENDQESKGKNSDDDRDYDDDDDDDRSLLELVNKEKQKSKSEKNSLVNEIKNLNKEDFSNDLTRPTPSSCSQQIVESTSPTKEDLKKKLADMEMKLQLFYCLTRKPEPKQPPSNNGVLSASDKGSENIPPTNLSQNLPTGLPKEPQPLSPSNEVMSDGGSEKNVATNDSQKLPTGHDDLCDGNQTAGSDNHTELNSSTSTLSPEEIDGHDFELSKDQLFGECADTVKLGQNIFCKKDVLKAALKGSTEVTHVARRLIEGVFKKEALLKCTLTGTPYRAGGKDKITKVDGLNIRAVQTIISYAKEIGRIRSWPNVKSKTIRTSMTQRLGEIKRQNKNK